MQDGWLAVLSVIGVLLVLMVGAGLAVPVRRRLLARPGATFELSHRMRPQHPTRAWVLGMGRYTGESLEWFRFFSLSPRPKRVWSRDEIVYEGQREPEASEHVSLYADQVVVVCRTPEGPLELAMSASSLMGFQSWVESGPPGTNWDSRPLR